MLAGSFVERGYRALLDRLLVRHMAAYPVRADWITAGGLALSLLVALAAPWSAVAAGLLLLAAAVLDGVDGALSRATGKTSPAGALLDSTFDRYAEFAAILGAWARLNRLGEGLAAGLLALCALQGSLMVSYTRARAEGLGLSLRGGLFERPERVLVLAAGFFASPADATLGLPQGAFLAAALGVLAVGANATALSRLHRGRKALTRRR